MDLFKSSYGLHRGLTEKERKYKIGILLFNLVLSIVLLIVAHFRAANIVLCFAFTI